MKVLSHPNANTKGIKVAHTYSCRRPLDCTKKLSIVCTSTFQRTVWQTCESLCSSITMVVVPMLYSSALLSFLGLTAFFLLSSPSNSSQYSVALCDLGWPQKIIRWNSLLEISEVMLWFNTHRVSRMIYIIIAIANRVWSIFCSFLWKLCKNENQ